MTDFEIICDIKKQLQTIHEEIDTLVSKGEDQEALLSYSQSITNVSLSRFKN